MTLAALKDWLGEGGTPVNSGLAAQRAVICRDCPENRAPLWWEKMTKEPIAAVIRSQLALKHDLNLAVEHEDDLHMCRVCGCCIRLKVWVPISHIKKHTSPEQLLKFPNWCWIRDEYDS